MYVLKFRGAGQGQKALIAELVAGEIGRVLRLPVPELVLVDLDPALSNAEPDPEIQELLKASAGLNLALDYLPGSLAFVPAVAPPLDPTLAAMIVWFDAFVTNVDRTPRNPNLLLWHRNLWLIDHGASLYFQHTWFDPEARSRTAFPQIKDHILLPFASSIAEVDHGLRALLTPEVITSIVSLIPESWLVDDTPFLDAETHRTGFVDFLTRRLAAADLFVEEAERARVQSGNTRAV